MTDETTETPAGETQADESGAEPAPATTAAVEPAGAHEGVPFWQRPNVERYLLPLVTPIVVVLAIVIFVLNLSRVFLSAHGHIPVVAGSIITVVILVGATLISNSRHMRSHSAILMTCGFVLIAISAGWLVLGHSEVKTEGGTAIAAEGPCIGTLNFTALPSLKFAPASVEAEDRHLLHHPDRPGRRDAHPRLRRPRHAVPRPRGHAGGAEGHGPGLLRYGGRLHLLLRDHRPPRGRDGRCRARHRRHDDRPGGRGRRRGGVRRSRSDRGQWRDRRQPARRRARGARTPPPGPVPAGPHARLPSLPAAGRPVRRRRTRPSAPTRRAMPAPPACRGRCARRGSRGGSP